jgi:hypothetical protein
MAIDTRTLAYPRDGASPRFVTTTVEVEGREETKVVELPDTTPRHGEPTPSSTSWASVCSARMRREGRGPRRYTADTARAGMLHAVILRSTIARGRAEIDVAPARAGRRRGGRHRRVGSRAADPSAGGALFDTSVAYAASRSRPCARRRSRRAPRRRSDRVRYESSRRGHIRGSGRRRALRRSACVVARAATDPGGRPTSRARRRRRRARRPRSRAGRRGGRR